MAGATRLDGPQGHREPGSDLSHSIARMAQPLGREGGGTPTLRRGGRTPARTSNACYLNVAESSTFYTSSLDVEAESSLLSALQPMPSQLGPSSSTSTPVAARPGSNIAKMHWTRRLPCHSPWPQLVLALKTLQTALCLRSRINNVRLECPSCRTIDSKATPAVNHH